LREQGHRAGRGEDPLEVVIMSTVPWRRSRRRPTAVVTLPCAQRTVGVEAPRAGGWTPRRPVSRAWPYSAWTHRT